MIRKKKLRANEFNKLTELIARCANQAIEDSRKDYRVQKAYGESDVSDDDFSILWSCYENSSFSTDRDEKYKSFIEHESKVLVQNEIGPCFKNKKRFEIMLPIIFYSLIVQNESNNATVVRRENKVLSAIKNNKALPSWNIRDPYREWKNIYRPQNDEEESFSNMLKDISLQSVETNIKENSFIDDKVKKIIAVLPELSGCFYHAKFYSDTSRAGQFLYYILNEADDKSKPLDTIIRMYCISELQNTLQDCRAICEETIYAALDGRKHVRNYNSKDILREYALTCLRDPYGNGILSTVRYDFQVYYIGDGDDPNIEAFLSQNHKKEDVFSEYYKYLSENFYFDISDIIEFYLDEEKLSTYIDADKLLVQYEKAVRNLLLVLPKLKHVEQKTEQVLSLSKEISKRKDMIKIQDSIFAFSTEEEANAHKARHSSQTMEELWEAAMSLINNDPREYRRFKLTDKHRIKYGIDEDGNYSVLNIIEEEI